MRHTLHEREEKRELLERKTHRRERERDERTGWTFLDDLDHVELDLISSLYESVSGCVGVVVATFRSE